LEKFALLNLLNALNTLASKTPAKGATADSRAENAETAADGAQKPVKDTVPAEQTVTYPNVMASVLERHEAISNRIKNKK